MSQKAINMMLALAVFLICLTVYLVTMQPTTSFWDSGEFIATSYILGIPHSPGTPLYVLIGRIFAMLSLPISVAQKVNFMSALFGALGVMMVYLVIVEVLRFMYGEAKSKLGMFARYAGPVVGSFFIAFSDTYWIDATEAEVYSISAFMMGFCTWLALQWYKNPRGELDPSVKEQLAGMADKREAKRAIAEGEKKARSHSRNLVYLMIYLLSLGIGLHLGAILVYGGIVLLFIMIKKKAFSNFELLVFTFGLAVLIADMTLHKQSQLTVVGLVIFAVLVVWSTISEGKFALTATSLLILGISVHLFLFIRSGMDPAIDEVDPETWRQLYAHLRREQYPPINIFNRKASIIFQLQHFGRYFREQFRLLGDIRLGPLNLGASTIAIPSLIGFYGIATNYNRERKTWVLNFTSLFLNSLGLLIFLNFSDDEVRERDYFYGAAFYYFAIFIGIGASAFLMMMLEGVRAQKQKFCRWILPVGIALVAISLLPLRYHWFDHDRSANYIPRDYAYNMLAGLEPDAIIFTNGDNDTFPLWYITNVEHFRKDVRVANLSLLNTKWYIKQLRDTEPKVPITLTDKEIDRMRPVRLRDGGVAWVRDLATQHIIQSVHWTRPIYFAVTVPMESWKPYSEYLEMQGMVRQLVPRKGRGMVNEYMLERNFEDIFEFRGVLKEDGEVDNSLYKSRDTKGMFVNFAIASTELARRKAAHKNYEEAVYWSEYALKFNPEFKWARMLLGSYYLLGGQPGKAVEYYQNQIRKEPTEGEYWLQLARVYEFQEQIKTALQNILQGIQLVPNYKALYEDGIRMATRIGDAGLAKSFVTRWLEKHPNDMRFRGYYSEIDSFMQEMFGDVPAAEQQ